jgi:predicted component of type VI protein secretion system
MKWGLVVDQGMHKGRVIPLPSLPFVIGRDEGCQLRPVSPSVSHRHCALLVQGEKIILCDFHSTNGTLVNGQRIEGEVELHPGDRLTIGPLAFVVFRKGDKLLTRTSQNPATEDPTEPIDEDAVAAMLLSMEQENAQGSQVSGKDPRATSPPETEMSSGSTSTAGCEAVPEQRNENTAQAKKRTDTSSKSASRILKKYGHHGG